MIGILLTSDSVSGITYVYWAALYLHLFSASAWVGGILFVTGVLRPILEHYGKDTEELGIRIKVRFLGFTWMLVWSALITGLVILLWSSKFIFFDLSTLWGALIHIKLLLFIILAVVSKVLSISYREYNAAKDTKTTETDLTDKDVVLWRIRMIEQIQVWCAILILLLVSIMQMN
jgi:putative copper export protein